MPRVPPGRVRGIALIALAAVSWGTTGSVTTLLVAQASASPIVIGLARLWLAATLLLAAAHALDPPFAVARGDRVRAVVAGVAMATYQVAYFSAVVLAGITVAALVAICSAPLVIAGLAAGFLGERLTGRIGIALALAVTGTALLVGGVRSGAAHPAGFVAGALLALLAGTAYAAYAVLAKVSLVRTRPLSFAAASFAIAALALTPALAATEGALRQVQLGWPWMLYLGVVATAAAYALYTTGIRLVPVSVSGIVTLLEPLTAALLGVLAFGEPFGVPAAAGTALMFVALAVLVTSPAVSK